LDKTQCPHFIFSPIFAQVDIAPLCATNGYTSNLFRCTIKMIGVDDPEAFRLVLKVFSPDRIEEMFVQVMGKDKGEEMMEQMAKMELEANRKKEAAAQMNGQQNGVQNGAMEVGDGIYKFA
jgi:hypothetical protein